MLKSIDAQQKTTNKLIGAVEKQQMSQGATLETLNVHEKSMQGMLDAVSHSGKAIQKTLQAVEKTQSAQGATLRAVAGNNRKVRTVLGAVAQNQGIDEKTLTGLNSLSKMDHAQIAGIQGQVNSLGAGISHLGSQEATLQSALDVEGTDESNLGAKLSALGRGETDLVSSEAKDRDDISKLAINQEQIKQVQNTHHEGLRGLSAALKKNVAYVTEVANKALTNEKAISKLDAQLARDQQDESAVEQGARSEANRTEMLKGHISQYNSQLDNVEHRERDDSRELRAEIRDQQQFVNKISQAEAYELQMKDKMNHVEGELKSQSGAGEMPKKFNNLKGDLTDVMSKLQAVKGMEASDEQALQQFEAKEASDKASMDGARAQMGGEISQLNRADGTLGASLTKDREDLNNVISQSHHLDDEAKDLESQLSTEMNTAKGISSTLKNERHTLDSAGEVLGMEGKQVTDLTKNTQRIDAEAQQIAQTSSADKKNADGLEKNLVNIEQQKQHLDEETAGLTKEGAKILTQQDKEYAKIGEVKNRVNTKIKNLQMQMLSVPSNDAQKEMKSIESKQKATDSELSEVDRKLDKGSKDVSKERQHNDMLQKHEEALEKNEKALAKADEQLEANAKKAQASIHIFTVVLVIIVLVFGSLHNMWRGKLQELAKKKEEALKAAQEAEEAEYYDENAGYEGEGYDEGYEEGAGGQ